MIVNQSASDEATPTAESTALQCSSDHDIRSPYYCEENVWRIVYRHLHLNLVKDKSSSWQYNVVFISNKLRCCPMYMQRAAPNHPGEYVCWDYHVIVVRTRIVPPSSTDDSAPKSEVLDIDTWLTPYPCPFEDYIHNTFPYASSRDVKEQYLPLFRVIDATEYLKHFYSDRSHMFKDGKWSALPPNYKPIMNGLQITSEGNQEKVESLSNLEYYISMADDQATSVVSDSTRTEHRPLSLDEFRLRFS